MPRLETSREVERPVCSRPLSHFIWHRDGASLLTPHEKTGHSLADSPADIAQESRAGVLLQRGPGRHWEARHEARRFFEEATAERSRHRAYTSESPTAGPQELSSGKALNLGLEC